jgi:glycosyltransferase involved in cell wall biosynthesis
MAIFCTADSGCLPRAMIEGQRRVGDAVAGTNTRLVTPSAWSRWGLLRSGAQPERIAVVPHGVDTSLFRPASTEQRAAMRRSLGWTGRFVFLNVSAMTDNKGIDLLLRGFAQAAQANSDALLVLKGADELYPSGRFAEENLAKLRQAERSLCEGRLRYIGRTLSFRELAALYQAADAYVSPYRTESFNLPVLEAIASGLPAICTAGGPTDDFTTPDVALRIGSRLLPDPRYEAEQVKLEADLGHLSELMRQAMSDTAFADAARRLGPALVEARFTWKHAVDSLLAALPC